MGQFNKSETHCLKGVTFSAELFTKLYQAVTGAEGKGRDRLACASEEYVGKMEARRTVGRRRGPGAAAPDEKNDSPRSTP